MSQPRAASKAYIYDTHLCLESLEEWKSHESAGADHGLKLIRFITSASAACEHNGLCRLAQGLLLRFVKENIKRGAWNDAYQVASRLWRDMTFRKEQWWGIVEEIGWTCRQAALHMSDRALVLAIDWELMNADFVCQPKWHYDLTKTLDDFEDARSRSRVTLNNTDIHSFLTATFVFKQSEGRVGESYASQLAVSSSAMSRAAPLTFASIRIDFDGALEPIILKHEPSIDEVPRLVHTKLDLTVKALSSGEVGRETMASLDSKSASVGLETLVILPRQARIFEFRVPFREAGLIRAISATFIVNSTAFDLEYIHHFGESDVWWGESTLQRRVTQPGAVSINVLPKPPKLELNLPGLQECYYTNEEVIINLRVLNQEDVDSIADLEVQLLGAHTPSLFLIWNSNVAHSMSQHEMSSVEVSLGRIISKASLFVDIHIPRLEVPSVFDLRIKANYFLFPDPATKIYCSKLIKLNISTPFEADFEFAPGIHLESWPNYFDTRPVKFENCGDGKALGLAQRWYLIVRYASFATTDLVIEDITIDVQTLKRSNSCLVQRLSHVPEGGLLVVPRIVEEARFQIDTRKLSLDDQGTAALNIALLIKWRRLEDDASINKTSLSVPRLLISGSEPRVLAAVSYRTLGLAQIIHFDLVVENPSNHLLTFGLSMDPEQSAFAGTKHSTFHLLPLGRRIVKFRLLPYSTGDWIGPIKCIVRDKYFQKTLKILPTEGMKLDLEGMFVWVPSLEKV